MPLTNTDGAFTLFTTGTAIAINIGGQPNHLDFEIHPKSNSDANVEIFAGSVDAGGYQSARSTYGDSGNEESVGFPSNTKCIYVRRWNGSAWVTELEATFHSFYASGFKLNCTTANSNYAIFVKARV